MLLYPILYGKERSLKFLYQHYRNLKIMAAVCVTLFILSMERQSQQTGTLTAGWIEKWNLHGRSPNPPDMRVPRKLEYLHRYNIEAAYIPTRGTLESNKSYRR